MFYRHGISIPCLTNSVKTLKVTDNRRNVIELKQNSGESENAINVWYRSSCTQTVIVLLGLAASDDVTGDRGLGSSGVVVGTRGATGDEVDRR